jgi:hypothetical protein
MSQTGLFSAAVATLLTVSTQDLKQDSADISAFYLAKIYQLQADGNGSQASIISTLSPPPSNFSPPNHAVLVNSLWFLSLAISITCALSATLVQQWARRYIKATQQSYSPQKQARIRAFFAEGVDKFRLPLVVELLPTFLHLSVFLFFAGLGVFLFHLNHKVFIAVIWWLGLCALAYICIIFMPTIRHDSPYYSPLSSLVWHLWTGMLCICLMILGWFTRFECFSYASWEHIQHWRERYCKWFRHGIQRAAEESAQKLSPEIDGRALVWTLEAFVRDQDPNNKLEDFVRGIPAFCNPKAVKVLHAEKISESLVGLLHHTLSSNLANKHRIGICIDAIREATLPITWRILRRVIYKDWGELLDSVDFVDLLRKTTYNDPKADYNSKCVIAAHIRATAQKHDDRWFELATCQLDKSRAILEGYLTHGDSISLANCINICDRTIDAYSKNNWTTGAGWRSKCFQIVSDFDPSNTLPELQYEFCRLWNELILFAKNPEDRRMQTLAMLILRHIRKIYIAIHQGTYAAPTKFNAFTDDYNNVLFYPDSYPLCSIPEHDTAGPIGGTSHARDPTSNIVTPTAPAASSSSASRQSNPTHYLAHGMTLDGVPDMSHHTPQVTASSRSTVAPLEGHLQLIPPPRATIQGTTDFPDTPLTASSNTYSTQAASISIPLQDLAPPSSGTATTLEAPGLSPSLTPATVPGHIPPAESDPCSSSPPSRFDQTLSATAVSPASTQVNRNVAGPDVPIPVEAPHETSLSGPGRPIHVSFDAAPFPHDVDRSQ